MRIANVTLEQRRSEVRRSHIFNFKVIFPFRLQIYVMRLSHGSGSFKWRNILLINLIIKRIVLVTLMLVMKSMLLPKVEILWFHVIGLGRRICASLNDQIIQVVGRLRRLISIKLKYNLTLMRYFNVNTQMLLRCMQPLISWPSIIGMLVVVPMTWKLRTKEGPIMERSMDWAF